MSSLSTADLGFEARLPAELQMSRLLEYYDPEVSDEQRVRLVTELIRQNSLLTVKEVSESLALLAIDPGTPLTQRLSILETHVRLAGLDKKSQQDAAPQVSKYQLTLNFSSGAKEQFQGITIEHPAAEETTPSVEAGHQPLIISTT